MNAIVKAIVAHTGLSENAVSVLSDMLGAAWDAIPQETKDKAAAAVIHEAKALAWPIARFAADYALKRLAEGAPAALFDGVDLVPLSPPITLHQTPPDPNP